MRRGARCGVVRDAAWCAMRRGEESLAERESGAIFPPVRVIVAAADAVLREILETGVRAAGYPVDAHAASVAELRDSLEPPVVDRAGDPLVVTGPGWLHAEPFARAALSQGVPVAIWPMPAAQRAPSVRGRDRLTDREREVLELVASGVSNKGIARRLRLSPNTVKFHIAGALAKLGASTRAEAVAAAARRGELAL